MHTCIFPFASSSTRKLVRSLLTDNEPTRFVVSAHFHSNISHAKLVRAYAFRSGAHFHAYSSNHHLLQAVRGKTNKTTAFPREHEYTSFISSRIQHYFVNCLTLTIIRHHVHQYHSQYHSSENSTRACQIPLSIRKVIHSRPFLLRTSNSTALNQPCILHAIQSSTTHAY